MSTAPPRAKKRLPAIAYFQLIYGAVALLVLTGLYFWGPREYSGATALWLLAAFFGPWMVISFTWIMIDVIHSERSGARELRTAQRQHTAYLATLRTTGQLTEVYDQDGITAFIVNGDPQQRLNVRIKANKLTVAYNCDEAKWAALSTATQASTPELSIELELEDLTTVGESA